jgi:phosphate transport system permease protein
MNDRPGEYVRSHSLLYGTGAVQAAAARKAARPHTVRSYTADVTAVGEPALWGFGGALALGIILIAGFLGIVLWNGLTTFWPKPVYLVELKDGTILAGEPFRQGTYRPAEDVLARATPEQRALVEARGGFSDRILYRTANFDLYGNDFVWVSDYQVANRTRPEDFFTFERQEWGKFIGRITGLIIDDKPVPTAEITQEKVQAAQREARQRFEQIRRIERGDIGAVNYRIEQERLAARRAALRHGADSAQAEAAAARAERNIAALQADFQRYQAQVDEIRAADRRNRIILQEVNGRTKETELSQIVRFFAPNAIGLGGKIGIYFSRWHEFLTSEPREANTEGGVLPAIFGTVAMTMLMVVFVAPFGVITALYLREYAKQGRLVSAVRISVNNLAGVPSIVYGVFGLGFFAYTMGTTIDGLFFPERLPSPTFGTGGILWASLTLALLTVPVVIVASEEALAAVPRSMREGSLACGASKWQTIRYVVLPKALPGIMTGLILAMARGAGEVAPLMLVGVVKLAPALPFDQFFPFIHLERSFMHLGFHIFDVGFQSRNSEAGKPMVFVTTLLLLVLIVMMNSTAIYIRNRLKRKYASGQF